MNVPCRRCARGPVQCIQPSRRGAYLRCAACGDIWLEDDLVITRRTPVASPRRRRSDAVVSGMTPADEGPSTSAYRPAQCAETSKVIQHLADRITQLEEENRSLREAARAFGELAERLSEQLRADREPPESA